MNMDMQALIEEMSALILKIKSGSATQGELEAFAAAAAELHERAVVLRYKSYEAKVFGTPVAPVREMEPASAPEPVAEPAAETVTETPEAADEPEEVSFDLFQEPEGETESFDLFSLDSEEEDVLEAPVVQTDPEPVVTPEPEIPAMEEEEEEPVVQLEEAASHQPEEATTPEPEPVVQETIPTPEPEPAAPVASVPSGAIHPVYKRLVTDDNSLGARLMAVRLETLQGAFGFNERLQIIRELFNGSNEEFSQAISQLDSLGSKNEARTIVSSYAHQFAWDKDSDLALEFVQKVERRYA